MKKGLIKVLAIMLVCSLALPTVGFANVFDNEYTVDDFKAGLSVEDDFEVFMDAEDLSPSFITGFETDGTYDDEEEIELFINGKKELFDLKGDLFDVIETEKDELNTTHYKVAQKMDSIPVYGAELFVHTNEKGKVYAINGNAVKNVEKANWNSKFKMNDKKAIAAGLTHLGLNGDVEYITEPTAEKFIYPFEGKNYPVYLVTLRYSKPTTAFYKIFVNAENGDIVDKFNALTYSAATGTGIGYDGTTKNINLSLESGTYYLKDTTKAAEIRTYDAGDRTSIPGTIVSDSDNKFDSARQKSAVDAHYFVGVTYDYFKNTHGRNSYDGAGAAVLTSVHYGNNESNAFWDGKQMAYGEGDGTQFGPFSGSLDVVGHEFTHAVTEKTCDLEYRNQSGALNESMSDVFGAIIEAKHTGKTDWWILGEEITTPNKPGDCLGNMKDPSLGLDPQPGHMNDYKVMTSDNGGVHVNSGIPNRGYYEIAIVIGHDKAEKIYYRALTKYLTKTSQFMDCRNALIQSAKDLYGADSAEHKAVQNGYATIGIGEAYSGGTTPPPTGDKTWTTENVTIESPHNYTNYYTDVKTYTKAGAEKVSVHFLNLRVEQDYDFIYVMDKNDNVIKKITGNSDNTWVEVTGDTVKIKIETDYSVTDWGYKVDQVKYYK